MGKRETMRTLRKHRKSALWLFVADIVLTIVFAVVVVNVTREPTYDIVFPRDMEITEPVEVTPSPIGYETWTKYSVPLDRDMQEYTVSVAEQYGIEPELLFAIMEKESHFDAGAVGDHGNSLGLMQIYASCHTDRMERLGVTNLADPKQNVLVGADIISELIGYGNGTEWALSYYSGNEGRECDYSEAVLSRAEQLSESVKDVPVEP